MMITGRAGLRRGPGDAGRGRRGDDRHRHGAGRRSAATVGWRGWRSARRCASSSTPRPGCRSQSKLVASAREVPLIDRRRPAGAGRAQERRFARPASRVIEVGDGPGGVDLVATFAMLAETGSRGCSSRAARASRVLARRGRLVDEVVLFRAPVVVGPDGVRALERLCAVGDRAEPALPPNRGRNCRRRPDAALSEGFLTSCSRASSPISARSSAPAQRNDVRRLSIACRHRRRRAGRSALRSPATACA